VLELTRRLGSGSVLDPGWPGIFAGAVAAAFTLVFLVRLAADVGFGRRMGLGWYGTLVGGLTAAVLARALALG
jgi:hypothetical protein